MDNVGLKTCDTRPVTTGRLSPVVTASTTHTQADRTARVRRPSCRLVCRETRQVQICFFFCEKALHCFTAFASVRVSRKWPVETQQFVVIIFIYIRFTLYHLCRHNVLHHFSDFCTEMTCH